MAAASTLAEHGPLSRRSIWRRIIDLQIHTTYWFDRFLPQSMRVDGNRDFIDRLVPDYLTRGAVVYDVGGGKNPLINVHSRSRLGISLVGIDLDPAELEAAPEGTYDRTICADICSYRGTADADIVICQALLEHVVGTTAALDRIAGILKPNGLALLFVPSRNAVFARINLLLPERWKRKILFLLYPSRRRDQGFPAYYDHCTPRDLEVAARRSGMKVEARRLYFQSDYFRFCVPLHVLWRVWTLLFSLVAPVQSAETFSLVLRKEKQ